MNPNICFLSPTSSFLLLILLIFTLNRISAHRSEAEYKTLNIESPELCSSVVTKKEWLDKRDKSGLIVRQTRLSYHPILWEKNSLCKFKVLSNVQGSSLIPKIFGTFSKYETGVIAVIQELVFRRNDTADECIDYVQFRLSNGQTTQKFCGIHTTSFAMDHRFQESPTYDSWGLGAAKSKEEIEVIIFISKEPLQDGETMDLEIVFTLYTDCTHDKDRRMRPCSQFHRDTCIPEKFFNDSIVNCPYVDCVDEGGCSNNDIISIFDDVQPYYGTKVLIGSVSFLFLLFGAFVCFIWMCKKHKILCWADEFAHPTQTTRVIELSENPAVATATAMPSAPAVPPPEEDKPPSYESLFPSR